jgi:GLPGLI family protein
MKSSDIKFAAMILLTGFVYTSLYGQTAKETPVGKVIYTQIVAKQKDSVVKDYSYTSKEMFLYFGREASVYRQELKSIAKEPVYHFKGSRAEDSALVSKSRIKAEMDSKLPGDRMSSKPSGSILYKNYSGPDIKTQQIFNGENFIIEDTLPVINWKISGDTKEIATYQCRKATGTFRGRNYEAWFTPAIPVPAGPWKLNGLPGLILEAADSENEIIFRLQSVTIPNPDEDISISNQFTGETITAGAYKQKVTKNIERMANMLKASSGKSTVNIQQLVPMEKDKNL